MTMKIVPSPPGEKQKSDGKQEMKCESNGNKKPKGTTEPKIAWERKSSKKHKRNGKQESEMQKQRRQETERHNEEPKIMGTQKRWKEKAQVKEDYEEIEYRFTSNHMMSKSRVANALRSASQRRL